MARVASESAFNKPIGVYKRTRRSQQKRDTISTALGIIKITKGVGPLIDKAAAGISSAIAGGEREDAIAAAKEKRLALERQKAGQERARVQAIEEQRAEAEARAKYGPGFTPDLITDRTRAGRQWMGTTNLSLDPTLTGEISGALPAPLPYGSTRLEEAASFAQTFPGMQAGMPGVRAPVVTLPAALEPDQARFNRLLMPQNVATPQQVAGIAPPTLPGVPSLQLTAPGSVPGTIGYDPSADPNVLARVPGAIPTPPPPPPIPQVTAPAPGVVYPPGTPGAPPPPRMPVPEGTVSGRFYTAGEKYRRYLEQTRGTAIPAMEDLLQMSLDELRTLAKFGLSSDPRRRVDELKRIGQASTIVGRVERPAGLLGMISGTRGGAAGRRYALDLATKEKPQPDALMIAGKMAGMELTGERVDKLRTKRLKKKARSLRPPSKGFRTLYYKDSVSGWWKPKYGDKTYWDKIGGGAKRKKRFEDRYDKLSAGRKEKYAKSADRRNVTMQRIIPRKPTPIKPTTPRAESQGSITDRRDAQNGLDMARRLKVKGLKGAKLDSGVVRIAKDAISAELDKPFTPPPAPKVRGGKAVVESPDQLKKREGKAKGAWDRRRKRLLQAQGLLLKYRPPSGARSAPAPAAPAAAPAAAIQRGSEAATGTVKPARKTKRRKRYPPKRRATTPKPKFKGVDN